MERKSRLVEVFGSSTILIGMFTGGITVNPAVMGVLSGVGALALWAKPRLGYDSKSEGCTNAVVACAKVLTELRTYMRGESVYYLKFIKMGTIEDGIIESKAPDMTRLEHRYHKRWFIDNEDGTEEVFREYISGSVATPQVQASGQQE